jgi:hypothetical protein
MAGHLATILLDAVVQKKLFLAGRISALLGDVLKSGT